MVVMESFKNILSRNGYDVNLESLELVKVLYDELSTLKKDYKHLQTTHTLRERSLFAAKKQVFIFVFLHSSFLFSPNLVIISRICRAD